MSLLARVVVVTLPGKPVPLDLNDKWMGGWTAGTLVVFTCY